MLTMEVAEEFVPLQKDTFSSTQGGEVSAQPDPEYQFLTDIWVGIVLTLMVLSCVCCMCSCVLYHKFQQWKMSAIQARNQANLESGGAEAELPSYTIASGLPTYQEALEQLKKVKELTKTKCEITEETSKAQPATLSVVNLFQLYNEVAKPS